MTGEERELLRQYVSAVKIMKLADREAEARRRERNRTEGKHLRRVERLLRKLANMRAELDRWKARYRGACQERDALWAEIDARRATQVEPYRTEGARLAARSRTFREHSARAYQRRKA